MTNTEKITQDKAVTLSDSCAEVVDLKTDILQGVKDWIYQEDIDINRITQNQYISCIDYIYNRYIKDIYLKNNTGYKYDDYKTILCLCDIFINICFRLNRRITIYGFSRFSGIDDNTLYSWRDSPKATPEQREIIKKLFESGKEAITGRIYDGYTNPVGVIFLAKNEYGYTDSKIIEHKADRQADSLEGIADKLGVKRLEG